MDHVVFGLISRIVKYVLIAIVYIFILKVVKMVYKDISDTQRARRAATDGLAYLKLTARRRDVGFKLYDTYAIRENTTIGRSKKCDVYIPDPFLSSNHARIFFADGDYYLEDMGSTNGTLYNGKYIGNYTVPLKTGDKLGFGHVTFTFMEDEE